MKNICLSLADRLISRAARKMTKEEADRYCGDLRTRVRREKIAAAAVKKAQHARARYTVIHGRRAM